MNVNSIITIVIYTLFFLTLIVGFLWGLGRGLKKSSIRIGTLIILLIIAGFITSPISKALLTIDLSSLNININGTVVTTIPEAIKSSLFSIQGFQEAAISMPSVMTFVDGLPVAIVNIVVFLLLVFIMQFISWIVSIILSSILLKESKLEKMIKKQKKLEKKNKGQNASLEIKSNPLTPPKKRRLLGALIGTIQSFILIFLVFMPITSLAGSIGQVISTSSTSAGTSLVIYAEENNNSLSESSADLLKNTLGEETISYFNTFNNSVPAKVLSLFGFNNVIFDSLTTVKVNGEGIAFRRDALSATKIYDKYVEIIENIGENDTWELFDFEVVRDAINIVFDTGIFKAFAEDVIPYALDTYGVEMFLSMDYGIEVKDGLNLVIANYKEDPSGFIKSFKKDILSFVDIVEPVFKSGFFDQVMSNASDYNSLIEIVKEDGYSLLSQITDNIFNSYIMRVATSKGLNVSLEQISIELSKDGTPINLGFTNYSTIDWNLSEGFLYDLLKNTLDIYDVIDLYDFESFISNPKTFFSEVANSDLENLLTLFGKEIDLLKDSPLFEGQENTPVKGLINFAGVKLAEFIDSNAMISISGWETELNNLSVSIIALKDSGILDAIIDSDLETEGIMDLLLNTVSEEANAKTYINVIITPIVSSKITKKVIIYGLNKATDAINESTELGLLNFELSDFTDDQNSDLSSIAENIVQCFSIFNSETGFDLATVDTSKLANLLTELQHNAFRVGAGSGIEKFNSDVSFTNKTINGGGMFANYYIALVTYLIGDNTGINLKTINWPTFFASAQSMSGNIDQFGNEESGLGDLFDLGNPETSEDLSNILDSLGLGNDEDGNGINDLVDDFSAITETLSDLETGEIPPEEAYQAINDAITGILNSTDGEGNSTVDSIVTMIESITGDDTISSKISSEIIISEQTVSNRLYIATSTYNSENPIDYTSPALDSIHTDMTVFEATLADLTCGATYVLQQATNNGTKVYVTNISEEDLTIAINNATTNENIRTLVYSIFK